MASPVLIAPRAAPAALEAALADLAAILGDRLTRNAEIRAQHGRDESFHAAVPPDAVAFVETTAEIQAVVRACARHGVPVIPFGTGTSLEGHVAALHGGVSLDVSRMNAILRVGADDLDCTVEAGVTRKQLNAHLRDMGLFFPIDPGADASLGGMAATRASGTNAVRYGTMRENVLGLAVVTADGSLIRTGGRARKSSAGYDLTRLFVGSEGTLGVIAEVTLRLAGIPQAISAAVSAFDGMAGAVRTVIETIQAGVPVARVELLDAVQLDAVNRYAKLDLAVAPTLFFEFHGTEAGVAEQAALVGEIAAANGGGGFRWARAAEDRSKLWQARHDAYYAALALRPGAKGWTTDVCVPISRLADCILETQADNAEAPFPVPLVGHVGDGNFHLVYLIDPESPEELRIADRLSRRLVARAIAMGGTCTGEHGVGYGKLDFVEAEHGPAVELMRRLKRALDPADILNPGKVVRLHSA